VISNNAGGEPFPLSAHSLAQTARLSGIDVIAHIGGGHPINRLEE